MGIKREKRRPVQLLALCQLRSGRMERHQRGELIPPGELEGGRVWSGLRAGTYGLRVVEAAAYPSHLAAETRNYGSRAGNVLVPVTDEMRQADEQAETRKADEQAEQNHAHAMRELEASEAEAKTAAARLAAAREAVQEVENELKGDSKNG